MTDVREVAVPDDPPRRWRRIHAVVILAIVLAVAATVGFIAVTRAQRPMDFADNDAFIEAVAASGIRCESVAPAALVGGNDPVWLGCPKEAILRRG